VRLYVASSWRNPEQPEIVELLRMVGHEVYDFRHPHLGPGERGLGFQWSDIDPAWQAWTPGQFRAALDHQRACDGFAADREGMEWAEGCVLVLPCGRSAHLEAGWMAGSGKPVFALLRDGEPELMYGLLEYLCITDSELLDAINHESYRMTRAR
jgi:hypothetical protein